MHTYHQEFPLSELRLLTGRMNFDALDLRTLILYDTSISKPVVNIEIILKLGRNMSGRLTGVSVLLARFLITYTLFPDFEHWRLSVGRLV